MRALLEAIQKHRVTVAILVSPLVVALTTNTAVEKYDLSSIRLVMSGVAPLGLQAEEALNCWRQLNKLVYLDLSHNNFSGKIPMSMGSLLDLQALFLRNNNLVEGIPFSLRNCTELVMLDMSENKLSGSIPDWIGTKEELQILSLGKNQFFGSLPLEVCCLRSIQVLDLSINNLSGKIPKCIKDLTSMTQTPSSIDYGYHSYFFKIGVFDTSMTYDLSALLTWKGSEQMFMNKGLSLLKLIDLSSNHFSGEILVEIEKLSGLISLNLSRNNLIGKIPSNIGKLASLNSLDLSRNWLVGSIPPSLAQLYGLGVLDLSHNHLSGKIPTGTQLQSFNKSSYENNLDLCGPPLERLCIDGKLTQEPNVKVYKDEYSFFNNDFFTSMAIGFALSFWTVFGSILFKRSWRHSYFNFLNKLTDNILVKVAIFRKNIYGE
ncbi:receptor-like protein EIX2 [Vigna unguiculata]|uniref:receptor-like protein EIX2 n=1 Tax=Vigna unguiculata TaxID=3917 RepID=UPI001016AE46|nr:receptor-like protein EIX2 [Vigna unguiculata]